LLKRIKLPNWIEIVTNAKFKGTKKTLLIYAARFFYIFKKQKD